MKSFIFILLSIVLFSCVSTNFREVSNEPTGVTGIANMFNERGFYKSNGFSFDEQEIINDFNGNLMFEKPLYNFALAGDLNLNLSLNYNGSVGHQFFLGDTSSYNNDPDPRRYNLNVA